MNLWHGDFHHFRPVSLLRLPTSLKHLFLIGGLEAGAELHINASSLVLKEGLSLGNNCKVFRGRGRKRCYCQTQYSVLTKTNELQDDHAEWYVTLSFVARMVVYVAILALFVIVVSLILKYLGDCDVEEATREQVTATETNRLLPKKAIPFTYGTCEEDLESGKCSSSSSESSDDLYDGKLCIFCYDEQRNCFFVPCGHCASCYVCAQRIIEGENKACPGVPKIHSQSKKTVYFTE
ncbi:hypothetical protein F0562_006325 [Nyssa sinensis]|uniref:RING-type domain-containing protein n=1 Tax=Nyssa sinensis TaxID=561372 RepID=A0A5J5APG3_9ASTE|nr:hypothetical protein F0562_006325 [Nyssa sinensis]